MQIHRPLTLVEREFIEFRLRLKTKLREIGRRLGREHSIISREVSSNGGKKKYSATRAQKRADSNRKKRGRKRKLETDEALHEHVVSRLRAGASPDVIAGKLKASPPTSESPLFGKSISHEAIYQYIYDGEGRWEDLYSCLLYRHQKRRKRFGRKPRGKALIPERISIDLRPEEIAARTTFGHWESDSVIFPGQKNVLSVQVERKSRLVRFHKAPDKTAESTEHAIRKTIESLPEELFLTMTFDNGSEGANHRTIRDECGITTYFCDPYASWQKGSVENLNGIIRRFLPRTKDLSVLTDREIHEIQERINDTERKCLGYLTPNEVIRQYREGLVR